MSSAVKLMSKYNIGKDFSFSVEKYKEEVMQKEQKEINKKKEEFAILIKPSDTVFLSYEIPIQDKFIWSERAIELNINSTKEINSFSIENLNIMTIERSYSKLKAIKIKGLLNNNNNQSKQKLTIENTILFSYTNASPFKKKDLTSKAQYKKFNNTFTEPSTHKNQLFNYLPKISKHSSPMANSRNLNFTFTNTINQEMLQLNVQYESMKRDLIELNPILKVNSSLREQFFINVSEGKEEKYIFIKNLYNIINDNPLFTKPKNKFKNVPVPNMTLNAHLHQSSNKQKINRQNFNGIRKMTKSASGSHIKRNGLNFLEGVNIK